MALCSTATGEGSLHEVGEAPGLFCLLTSRLRPRLLPFADYGEVSPQSWRRRTDSFGPSGDGFFHLLCLLDRFLDAADQEERLLGQVIVLTLDDLLEPADGIANRHILALEPGEL